uniref:Uncharacterized protein n=1 Tax=Rheinheimera sp. BAL341 TaxID=1708203 RepID=A0A486XWK1_9GAMM
MVSGVDRSQKIAPAADKSRQLQRSEADKPETDEVITRLESIARQLALVPVERQKEYLAQYMVTEVLQTKLGVSAVSEPEYARLVDSIKTTLLNSAQASEILAEAIKALPSDE